MYSQISGLFQRAHMPRRIKNKCPTCYIPPSLLCSLLTSEVEWAPGLVVVPSRGVLISLCFWSCIRITNSREMLQVLTERAWFCARAPLFLSPMFHQLNWTTSHPRVDKQTKNSFLESFWVGALESPLMTVCSLGPTSQAWIQQKHRELGLSLINSSPICL